jgi:hypothetical protein
MAPATFNGQHADEGAGVDRIDAGKTAGDTGVVDEYTDQPKVALGGFKKLEDIALPGDIGSDSDRFESRGRQLRYDLSGRGLVDHEVDGYAVPIGGQRFDNRRADPAAPAGDDRHRWF